MAVKSMRGEVAQLAATQWGLVTAAQATAVGVPRMLLTRMIATGELERVTYGVYATPAALSGDLTETRALWLALDPSRTAETRLRNRNTAGVLSHATAAGVHGIGDLLDDRVDVTTPSRHQTRRSELRIHVSALRPDEVALIDGLPVTTAERTVADLAHAGHDLDHVATVMAEAVRRDRTDLTAVERAVRARLGELRGARAMAQMLAATGLDRRSADRALARAVDARWPGLHFEAVLNRIGNASTPLEGVDAPADDFRRAVEAALHLGKKTQ